MGPKTTDPKDLLIGGLLQCCEAASVGMPFEVQYITFKRLYQYLYYLET